VLRHCEERSDEGFHERRKQPGLLRFARNDGATRMGFISRSGIDQTYTALINGLGQSFRFRGVGQQAHAGQFGRDFPAPKGAARTCRETY
jgi:hypothetical protein